MTRTTTPSRLTKYVLRLCREVVPGGSPRYVQVETDSAASPNECFVNVDQVVATSGGRRVLGWQIWEWPGLFVEAEFHAVWETPQGRLVDVTPKEETGHILFLMDDSRSYEGRQIDNVRRAILPFQEVEDFFAIAEAEHELKNRGERAYKHGELVLSGVEAQEYFELQRAKQEILDVLYSFECPGNSTPCPCGSGVKYKKCHGA